MPITPTYPGVYVQEIPSGVRTITGVATSITAFVGRTQRGPVDEPVTINSFADFERTFGGLWPKSPLTFAVHDFYMNGGSQAIIVRLFKSVAAGRKGTAHVSGNGKGIELKASTPGVWGNSLRFRIDHQAQPGTFNLQVHDTASGAIELFRNLSVDGSSERAVDRVLSHDSLLARCSNLPTSMPDAHSDPGRGKTIWEDDSSFTKLTLGDDGVQLDANSFTGAASIKQDGDVETKFDVIMISISDTEDEEKVIQAIKETMKMKIKDAKDLVDNVKKLAEKVKTHPMVKALLEGDIKEDDKLVAALRDGLQTESALTLVGPKGVNRRDAERIKKKLESVGADVKLVEKKSMQKSNTSSDAGEKKGLYALDYADLFNLLCIPPLSFSPNGDVPPPVLAEAMKYCEQRRAMLIVDPPAGWTDKAKAKDGMTTLGASKNAAVYFPRLSKPNPLRGNQIEDFAPCGAVAGVMARTDSERGVWKAPAGLDATLNGVPQLSVALTDAENGELNPLGINCLRSLPAAGRVVWGARTTKGNDRLASEWKYVSVRRLALHIEESLYRGTQWVVFEPNDEPLWAQIRLNLGTFMHDLFRKGAFQGTSPKEAYFVKCDHETTTQSDINLGVVNIVVGFAPLKPAEFVIISLQQMAGQLQT